MRFLLLRVFTRGYRLCNFAVDRRGLLIHGSCLLAVDRGTVVAGWSGSICGRLLGALRQEPRGTIQNLRG